MPLERELRVVIRARDLASRVFGRFGSVIGRVTKSLFSLRNLVIGGLGFYGLNRLMGSLIRAWGEQEKAVIGLRTAMISMGRYTPELMQKYLDLAVSLQKVTTFGDEAIIQGLKMMQTYKDITDDVMPRAARAMLDLAALMGRDVVGAANMLGKASMGLTGELRRVGITVDEGTYQAEGFLGVLKQIEEQVRGQAEALGTTGVGALERFGNAWVDVKERIGKVVTEAIRPLAEATTTVLFSLTDGIDKSSAKIINQLQKRILDFSIWILERTEGVIPKIAGVFDQIPRLISQITEHPDIVKIVSAGGLFSFLVLGPQGIAIYTTILGILYAFRDEIFGFLEELDAEIARIRRGVWGRELESLEIEVKLPPAERARSIADNFRGVADGLKDIRNSSSQAATATESWANRTLAAVRALIEELERQKELIGRPRPTPAPTRTPVPRPQISFLTEEPTLEFAKPELSARLPAPPMPPAPPPPPSIEPWQAFFGAIREGLVSIQLSQKEIIQGWTATTKILAEGGRAVAFALKRSFSDFLADWVNNNRRFSEAAKEAWDDFRRWVVRILAQVLTDLIAAKVSELGVVGLYESLKTGVVKTWSMIRRAISWEEAGEVAAAKATEAAAAQAAARAGAPGASVGTLLGVPGLGWFIAGATLLYGLTRLFKPKHEGGLIPSAHGGMILSHEIARLPEIIQDQLAPDEVLIRAVKGEGIVSPLGMSILGERGLEELNRGRIPMIFQMPRVPAAHEGLVPRVVRAERREEPQIVERHFHFEIKALDSADVEETVRNKIIPWLKYLSANDEKIIWEGGIKSW